MYKEGECVLAKILFASDLDNTLIYSNRFISNYDCRRPLEVVERKENLPRNYMCAEALNCLQQLNMNPEVVFVPVTARGISDYSTINLGFVPEYAIADGGGTILHKNKPMKEWEKVVHTALTDIDLKYVCTECTKLFKTLVHEPVIHDERLICFRMSNSEEWQQNLVIMQEKFSTCTFGLDGRNGYIFPNGINKGSSLKWLQNHLNIQTSLAVGDSTMDVPMLEVATYAFVTKESKICSFKRLTDNSNCLELMSLIQKAL